MCLAGMPVSPINQRLPPAPSGCVFGLPMGELAFIQIGTEGSMGNVQGLTGFDL
jgi:hypothetical protein